MNCEMNCEMSSGWLTLTRMNRSSAAHNNVIESLMSSTAVVPLWRHWNNVSSDDWSYANQNVLAPMVRLNKLSFRLLCRELGCRLLYSEELIAIKLSRTVRSVNASSGVISFVEPNDPSHVVFSTYEGEPIVCQIGAGNAVDALAAAQHVAADVRAIDLNMGCPKHFSLQGGMGAALLTDPQRVYDILATLRRNIALPITCKIRLLNDTHDTVELIRRAESAGIAAIAVHARHIPDRPRHRALPQQVLPLLQTVSVPLIYNGDCFLPSDVTTNRQYSNCNSVMIARGAINPSIFEATNDAAMRPIFSVAKRFLAICDEYESAFSNVKWPLIEMLKGHCGSLPQFQSLIQSKSMRDVDAAMERIHSAVQQHTCKEYRAAVYGPYAHAHPAFEDRPRMTASTAVTASDVIARSDFAVKTKLERTEKKRRSKARRTLAADTAVAAIAISAVD